MTLLPGIIWGWRSVRTSAPRECAQLSALVATRKGDGKLIKFHEGAGS